QRGVATLIASWEAYAQCADGASVQRYPGVTTAVFPYDPERGIYNNAVLARGLSPGARASAISQMEAAYAAAGVDAFAAWVHEADSALRCDLERLDYTLNETTRAMGMPLDDIRVPEPDLDLGCLDWSNYLELFDLPAGLLARGDREGLHVVVAALE